MEASETRNKYDNLRPKVLGYMKIFPEIVEEREINKPEQLIYLSWTILGTLVVDPTTSHVKQKPPHIDNMHVGG